MKVIKKTALGILILLILVIIISFLIPSKIRVERTLEIKASPASVFAIISNLHHWNEWSPWYKKDSTMKIVYEDKYEGEGAFYSWESKYSKVGNGTITIEQSNPHSFIKAKMLLGDMGVSTGSFLIVPITDGVKLKWSMENDGEGITWMMYVPLKYFSLFMDNIIGPDVETGLMKIKEIVESEPNIETFSGFEVEERDLPKMDIISIRERVRNEEVGKKLGEYYTLMGRYMVKSGITEIGNPFVIWHTYDTDKIDMEAVIPINRVALSKGEIAYSELPATKAIVVKYYGAYQKIELAYNIANEYIKQKGMTSIGAAREIYYTDPGIEKDTAKWLTEIAFPIE